MVVKTDKDNKMTGYVMTAIKNKHLAVDNPESYEILLKYFKMIGERLDKMQEDFKIWIKFYTLETSKFQANWSMMKLFQVEIWHIILNQKINS